MANLHIKGVGFGLAIIMGASKAAYELIAIKLDVEVRTTQKYN